MMEQLHQKVGGHLATRDLFCEVILDKHILSVGFFRAQNLIVRMIVMTIALPLRCMKEFRPQRTGLQPSFNCFLSGHHKIRRRRRRLVISLAFRC